jgi:hypothetical protein
MSNATTDPDHHYHLEPVDYDPWEDDPAGNPFQVAPGLSGRMRPVETIPGEQVAPILNNEPVVPLMGVMDIPTGKTE